MNFSRLIQPLAKKLMFVIGRGLVKRLGSTDNTGKPNSLSTISSNPQRLQMEALNGEVLTGIERAQEYGMETWPIPNSTSEAIAAFINGNRDNGVVICVKDDDHRPTDLSEGDVVLYGKKDKNNQQHRIHFKANGSIEVLVDPGSTISIGNGTDELLDLLDQLLTLLQGNVDTVGIASTGTNSLILADLVLLQTALGNLKA